MKLRNILPTLFTKKKKALVIVGPTASGKSSLAIEVAKKYNGEIISCDSRQIYKGLEIFSGAVTDETSDGVKHHIVSLVEPGETFSADCFTKEALRYIDQITEKEKLPIVAGGTGFWAQSLLYESVFPQVEPDYAFRETLESYTIKDLLEMLKQQDPERAKTVDPQNKKRIIRSLEIVRAVGKVPRAKHVSRKGYTFVLVYLSPEKEILDKRIRNNVSARMDQGLIKESEQALANLNEQQIIELGLGFKHVLDLQSGKISRADFAALMVQQEIGYAKRQKTFFKKLFKKYRGPKIHITDMDSHVRLKKTESLL